MYIHKNARLDLARRREPVQDVVDHKLTYATAAAVHGVIVPMVHKWAGRFLRQCELGLRDASSRPQASLRAIGSKTALAIIELRRRYHAAIARALGVSGSTVGRALRRVTLARWSDLKPSGAVLRYGHAFPGDLAHIDTKKVGHIEKFGHRVTGGPRGSTDGAGWDGSAFRSKRIAAACQKLGLHHAFARPYRPQTNGKAERFPQSALREWATALRIYRHSFVRTTMLTRWMHHYNWQPAPRNSSPRARQSPGSVQKRPIGASQLAREDCFGRHPRISRLGWARIPA